MLGGVTGWLDEGLLRWRKWPARTWRAPGEALRSQRLAGATGQQIRMPSRFHPWIAMTQVLSSTSSWRVSAGWRLSIKTGSKWPCWTKLRASAQVSAFFPGAEFSEACQRESWSSWRCRMPWCPAASVCIWAQNRQTVTWDTRVSDQFNNDASDAAGLGRLAEGQEGFVGGRCQRDLIQPGRDGGGHGWVSGQTGALRSSSISRPGQPGTLSSAGARCSGARRLTPHRDLGETGSRDEDGRRCSGTGLQGGPAQVGHFVEEAVIRLFAQAVEVSAQWKPRSITIRVSGRARRAR